MAKGVLSPLDPTPPSPSHTAPEPKQQPSAGPQCPRTPSVTMGSMVLKPTRKDFFQSYPRYTSQQFFMVWFQSIITHSHAQCRCCSWISAHTDVIFLAAFCKHTIKLCCAPQDLTSLLPLLVMFIALPENRKPPENVRGGFMLADKQMLSDQGENVISSFSR